MRTFTLAAFVALFVAAIQAQPQPSPTTLTAVPRLVRISSIYHPANGSAPAATQTVTIAIYPSEIGGAALWQETQNVSVDGDGHYSLLIGSSRTEGLPVELFTSGEPRWLGMQFQGAGEVEQPRSLLASVPYALKAADAETLGGQPLSAFVLAGPASSSNVPASNSGPFKQVKTSLPRISSGTPGYIGEFVNTTDLGNSVMYQNAGKIGLGTTNPLDYMHVAFTDTSGGVTGYTVQNLGSGTSSYSGMLFYDQNGVLGQFQGFNNSTHEYRINNVASNGSINFMLGSNSKFRVDSAGDLDITGSIIKNGTYFLHSLGTNNTALGISALAPSFSGRDNTGTGYQALHSISTGDYNTAIGSVALTSNTSGSFNTASGYRALLQNTTGSRNTALGEEALFNNTSGMGNIAVGDLAGFNLGTGNYNITIGSVGDLNGSDDHTIRIGDVQTNTYIAGIAGVSVANAATVLIDTNSGHLGTINSSRRYKEDIQDMGDISTNLLHLRPVTFRYKQAYEDGSKPLDYGLIAEEVAEIYPDLVVRNKDGQVETVQYHKLTPMLLNELQKLHSSLQSEQELNRQQSEKIRSLEARFASLEALLSSKER